MLSCATHLNSMHGRTTQACEMGVFTAHVQDLQFCSRYCGDSQLDVVYKQRVHHTQECKQVSEPYAA